MNEAEAVEKLAFNLTVSPGLSEDESRQMAVDLLDWHNIADPDIGDLKLLHALARAGQFEAWDCPTCGDRVYKGSPEDWGSFQGARQVDYTSYPSGHYRQCDYCRCHNPLSVCPKCGEDCE